MSPAFRSAAMLREYFGEILFHSPERSGLPSAVRGAGAARLRLAVGCARDSRRRVVQPLSASGAR